MEMLIFALALCAALFAAGLLGLLFAVKPIRPEPNARLTPREALVKWEAAGPARPGVCLLCFAPLSSALKKGEKALAAAAASRPLAGWERRFLQEAPLLRKGLRRLRKNRAALSGEERCEGRPKILLLCQLALRSSAKASGAGALEGSSFLRALAEREGSPAFAYARTVALLQLTLTFPERGEEERWLRRLSELSALFGGSRSEAPWQEGSFYAFREPDAAACLSAKEGGILVHRTGFYLALAGRRVHLDLPLVPRAATRTRLSFDCGKMRMAAELSARGLWLEYPAREAETAARLFLRPLLRALRLPHAEWVRRREGSFLAVARSSAGLREAKALCKGGIDPIRSEFGDFGKRLSHLLANAARPRAWKQEQLFLLLGRLRGMRGEELYRDARFCLLTADSHLTAAELEKMAGLTLVMDRFGLTCFLLIAGRREDLPPLSAEQRGLLGRAGCTLIPPDHPGLPVLAAQADLVCRGGKYRFQTPEADPAPERAEPAERPIRTSLDERFGLEEIFAGLAGPAGDPGTADLTLFGCGPRDRQRLRREVLDLFAHQTLDGSVCRAFSAHTAVTGDRRSTLTAVLLALFYARSFTDDFWEERIPYLECPADFGLSAPSAISDSLRYHLCNALQFLLTSEQGEGEAAFLSRLTGLAVRRVLPDLPEGCVKKQLRTELERLPNAPDTPLSLALKDLLKGPPAEAHLRGLTALRGLRGRRKRLFAAVLLRHFYDRVLGLRFHRNMVQIRPPQPLPDFRCRIGSFCCEVRRGERGVRLNDVFFTDLGFVSLDTPAASVIYY